MGRLQRKVKAVGQQGISLTVPLQRHHPKLSRKVRNRALHGTTRLTLWKRFWRWRICMFCTERRSSWPNVWHHFLCFYWNLFITEQVWLHATRGDTACTILANKENFPFEINASQIVRLVTRLIHNSMGLKSIIVNNQKSWNQQIHIIVLAHCSVERRI